MTTPLATIAEALIEFILSLLRDPAAAADFEANPEETLARKGLSNVCADDVRAVAPVIVDRPDVVARPAAVAPTPHATASANDPASVERAINNITNSFHIDNRATIVDQSVNQNIWAHGDVTQIFDQEAIINSGDHGAAAGHDAVVDESDTDITVGDVSIGNDETTTTITDSFDDESSTADTDITVGDTSGDAGDADAVAAVVVPDASGETDAGAADTDEADAAPGALGDAPVVDDGYDGADDPTGLVDDALPELDDQDQL
jgi:hypothetical protein